MELRHQSLVAWQRADDLLITIHQLTATFRSKEQDELASHLRRAAFSVPSNIVEACSRHHGRERLRFLSMSESALAELSYGLHVAKRLGYVSPERYTEMDRAVRHVSGPLVALIRSVNALADYAQGA